MKKAPKKKARTKSKKWPKNFYTSAKKCKLPEVSNEYEVVLNTLFVVSPELDLVMRFWKPFDVGVEPISKPKNWWNLLGWYRYRFCESLTVNSGSFTEVRIARKKTIRKAFTDICYQMAMHANAETNVPKA